MSNLLDLTQRTFGRLTVLRYVGGSRWLCRCVCGVEKAINGSVLREGRSNSCGCLRVEKGVARGKASKRHGEGSNGRESPEYTAWVQLRNRCNNPKHRQFADYGGRGIRVHPSWDSFERFLADVGRRPSSAHSLDRKDNDHGYEPGNVRWATRVEQNNNQRRSRRITIDGVERTLAEWLRVYPVSARHFYQRVKKGMSDADALRSPLR